MTPPPPLAPPPASNYPREHSSAREPFRVWRGDLIVGGLSLLDLALTIPELLQEAAKESDSGERAILLAAFLVLVAVSAWLLILVIRRKRWAMWLVLGLTAVSLLFTFADRFQDVQRHAKDAASFLLEIVTFVYLPLRLFGRLGPPPR